MDFASINSAEYVIDATPWNEQPTPEGIDGNGMAMLERCKEIGSQVIERNRLDRDSQPNICVVILRDDTSVRKLVNLVPTEAYTGSKFSAAAMRDLAGIRIEHFLLNARWRFGTVAEKLKYIADQERERADRANATHARQRASLADALAMGLGK